MTYALCSSIFLVFVFFQFFHFLNCFDMKNKRVWLFIWKVVQLAASFFLGMGADKMVN